MKLKIHGERREGKEQDCRYAIGRKEIWRGNKQVVDEKEEFLGSISKPWSENTCRNREVSDQPAKSRIAPYAGTPHTGL